MRTILTCWLSAAAWLVGATAASAAPPDISGIWIPDAELAQTWNPRDLPFTAAARTVFESFDARRKDSASFCMPLGTPRNILSTAPYPIEILQRPERITIIFDRLGDVRRIFLDGRKHPEEAAGTWLGHSVGRWRFDALEVETVGFNDESLLADSGLPHSAGMLVTEQFRVVRKNREEALVVEITITDPVAYSQPLRATRFFRRAPQASMSEGSGLCLLDQWRKRLERVNSDLAAANKQAEPAARQTP
jgi:hypothetical protein